MLSIRDLTKAYGDVVALRGVSLDVPAGSIVGLLGPNGAGKTTIVSIVAGLRRPDAGTVTVNDIDVLTRLQQARRLVGLAPQELGVYPTVTVRENLVLLGELAGLRGRQLAARIDEVAAALLLGELLGRLVNTLSGGEKRRLHTAMALLHRPPLLLLDEPTAGADVHTRASLVQVVRDLAAEGSAVLYSTHYLPEVEDLQADVALVLDGRVIAAGALKDLIATHGTAAVELTFDGPAPALRLDGEPATVDGSRLRIVTDDPTACAARALGELRKGSHRLRSVELIRPSLNSVFLTLTGRQYSDGQYSDGQHSDGQHSGEPAVPR